MGSTGRRRGAPSRPGIAGVVGAAALLAAAGPVRADATGDALAAALERHRAALVRVEATVSVGVEGLPGLGRGARRTHDVSAPGVVVGADGLVAVPLLALDPAGEAYALLGARPRLDVLRVVVAGADGQVRDAEWVGRDVTLGLAFVRVGASGRAGLAPVTLAAHAPSVGEPLALLRLASARADRAPTAEHARVASAGKAWATSPPAPLALGSLVTRLDGTPVGLLGALPGEGPTGDLLGPDALAERRAGWVLPAALLAPALASPPTEATPAATARRARAWLGARHEVVTPELAAAQGLDVEVGVRLVALWEGPAKVAGLKPGDVLLRLDGDPLDLDPGESFDDLVEDLGSGTKVVLDVRRAGKTQKVEVTLAPGPTRPRDAERASLPELGLVARAITFFDREEAKLPGDAPAAVVLGVAPDGDAARAGLREGDVIATVGGKPPASLADLRERLLAPGAHALGVRRRGEEVTLRLVRR